MTFGFHPDALAEYGESAVWYEERRSGLGIEFAASVEAGIAKILEAPERFQPVADGIRVFRLRRFPFNIFYRHNGKTDHVNVVAIMHHRRRPDYWRERL